MYLDSLAEYDIFNRLVYFLHESNNASSVIIPYLEAHLKNVSQLIFKMLERQNEFQTTLQK